MDVCTWLGHVVRPFTILLCLSGDPSPLPVPSFACPGHPALALRSWTGGIRSYESQWVYPLPRPRLSAAGSTVQSVSDFADSDIFHLDSLRRSVTWQSIANGSCNGTSGIGGVDNDGNCCDEGDTNGGVRELSVGGAKSE